MKKLIIIALLFMGCGTKTYYTPLYLEQKFPSKGSGCSIKLLSEEPTDIEFYQLGICRGFNNDFIEGRIDKAFDAMRDCACNNGADAMIYKRENDIINYDYLGQVTSASTSATIIKYK